MERKNRCRLFLYTGGIFLAAAFLMSACSRRAVEVAEEMPEEAAAEESETEEIKVEEIESVETETKDEPETQPESMDESAAESESEMDTEEETELETETETEQEEIPEALEVEPRQGDLGNWTSYNGIIFGNASIYDTTSGGGLAVGGKLNVNRDLTIGSTYSGAYDATLHIGEYKNENGYPALLYGGNQLEIGSSVHSLEVNGGPIAMEYGMLEKNDELESGFRPGVDSRYESISQEELDQWFGYQQKVISYTSENLGRGNDVSITLAELSDGSYLDYGAGYFKNQYFLVNGEVYDRALLITVRTDSEVNFGQWWPVYSILNVDVNWALDYDIVVFDFPDAVNVTMNSSAFSYQNMSHWSTTVDAWVGQQGMQERLALAEKVVYNFPGARSIQATHSLIQGTILAPNASFTGIGSGSEGHIYGHIAARNFTVQGNFTIHAFHLTRWAYDLVDDMLQGERETGDLYLQNYLYLRDQKTSIRISGGAYILQNEAGHFYAGDGRFSEEPGQAAVYYSETAEDMHITGLPYGTYLLRNIQAPPGFSVNMEDADKRETYYEIPIQLAEGEKEVVVQHYAEPVFIDIHFKKVDSDTGEPLEGAVFGIVREADEYEDTTIVSRYSSGTDGIFRSGKLPIGTYRLIEVRTPDGYEPMENEELWLQVYWEEEEAALRVKDEYGNIFEGTAENPVLIENLPGGTNHMLTVVKYADKEYQEGIYYTLPDAAFDLYMRMEDSGWEKVTENNTGESVDVRTNEMGYSRVEHLYAGRYRLVEKEAPAGYMPNNENKDEDFPGGYAHEFQVGEEETSHTAYLGSSAWNVNLAVAVSGNILEEKADIAGAAFRLERQLQQGDTWEEIIYRTLTDNEGMLYLEGLEAGNYRLIQLTTMAGYQRLNPAVIWFRVSFEDERPIITAVYGDEEIHADTWPVSLDREEGFRIQIHNEAQVRDYAVYKADAVYLAAEDKEKRFEQVYLEGAEFRLRRRVNSRMEWTDYGGTFTSMYQYDEEGNPVLDRYGKHMTQAVFSGGLLYGEYQLVETRPPSGYTSASQVEVTFQDGTVGKQVYIFTVTEAMAGVDEVLEYMAADYAVDHTTDLYFGKVDQENQKHNLKGAEFALYSCKKDHQHDWELTPDSCWMESTPVIKSSSSAGIVTYKELITGSYMLLEIQAPSGYRLSQEQWLIEADAAGDSFKVTAVRGGNVPVFIREDQIDAPAFLILNQKKVLLPFTGGAGLKWYFILSAGAFGMALFFYSMKKRGMKK